MWHSGLCFMPVLCGTDTLVCASFSQQRASLLERQPRIPWLHLRRIAVAEVDEEVRLDVSLGEELLIAALALTAGFEEVAVQPGVVEARHRPAVEPEAARGDEEIGALQ